MLSRSIFASIIARCSSTDATTVWRKSAKYLAQLATTLVVDRLLNVFFKPYQCTLSWGKIKPISIVTYSLIKEERTKRRVGRKADLGWPPGTPLSFLLETVRINSFPILRQQPEGWAGNSFPLPDDGSLFVNSVAPLGSETRIETFVSRRQSCRRESAD